MNKYGVVFSFLIGLALVSMPLQAEELQSLRGNLGLESPSVPPTVDRVIADDRPVAREFVQQPPIIPHKIEGYQVDKNFNK